MPAAARGQPARSVSNAEFRDVGLFRRLRQAFADLGAEAVDRRELLVALDMPEGPAVAGLEPLSERTDAVDRADRLAERDRAVGAHQRLHLALGVEQRLA